MGFVLDQEGHNSRFASCCDRRICHCVINVTIRSKRHRALPKLVYIPDLRSQEIDSTQTISTNCLLVNSRWQKHKVDMLSSFALLSFLSLASATSIDRGTQQVATFDDLTAIPAVSEINPVGSYKGLKYNSLDILQTGVLGISAAPAQSGTQVAAASITNYLNTGGVSIAADTVKYFDLQSLYVLCAVDTVTSAVGVPEECSVAFTAYKLNSDVAYDTFNFQFNPDTPLSSQMDKVVFPGS